MAAAVSKKMVIVIASRSATKIGPERWSGTDLTIDNRCVALLVQIFAFSHVEIHRWGSADLASATTS